MKSTTPTKPVTLGAHIAAGTAYFGLAVAEVGPLVDDELDRLTLAPGGDEAAAFVEFSDRFEQQLRRVQPEIVGVMHTTKATWVYRQAFPRVALEALMMVAAARNGISYVRVKPHTAAKGVGLSYPFDPAKIRAVLGLDAVPTHWKERSIAFVAAAYLATDIA